MTLPSTIAALLSDALPGFEIATSFRADIGSSERFADHWVLLALVGSGTVELLPWPELGTITCHRYVGSGSLTTGHGTDIRLIARFSAARMADAQNFARADNQIRAGVSPATIDDRPETPRTDNQPDFDGPPVDNRAVARFRQLRAGWKTVNFPTTEILVSRHEGHRL